MRQRLQGAMLAVGLLILVSCTTIPKPASTGLLAGLTITVDAGHGHTRKTDHGRVGPSGEREEWVNLRIARELQKLLRQNGAKVIMTREKDEDVNLAARASIAISNQSDFLISIHHNGSFNDTTLDFPLAYIWGDAERNPASVDLGRAILNRVDQKLKFQSGDGSGVYSDFLIYNEGTSILRNTNPILPGVIGEMGFFTNAAGEARMKDRQANHLEAQAYLQGLIDYAARGIPKAIPLKPVGSDFLRPDSPEIIFQLEDGQGGHAFDSGSIAVLVDGDTVPHEWDRVTGRLVATPPRCAHETVEVRVYGRNENGNALHPRRWDFLTMIGKENDWHGPWYVAIQRADSLRVLLNPADRDFAVKLDSTILWFERVLKAQSINPRGAEAEYRLGQLYEMRADWLKDDLAKEKALDHFNRVIAFYPTSKFVQPAKDEKVVLEEVF
ncbi:MAG: hypothetical protein AUJ47_05625 [Candidatus Marinimicrobia bacterium CG1_02_48_14]|nr:MAG: hypothetical protein AUJ47_05625 [Candidatus Marinimicrobia bacterium CG1_02_48_14]